jgi:alginate O-acetyltransferase complex protein AlgI
MVFASNIFVLGFLPVFLIAYYLTPMAWRSVPILIGSYIFYAWWRVDFVFLFAAVTLWNYLVYLLIVRHDSRRWMQIGVAGNLLVLGFFKYFNFGVDSLNAVITAAGGVPIQALHVLLPIGISFYIFQAISFLIDIHRKDAPHPNSFWDFAAFISLFPQLIAGPILRYKDVAEQFHTRTHSMDLFAEGAYRFMIGFAQKILIADSVAPMADAAFALNNPTFMEAWLGTLAYSIELYFDFAGYSAMAVGLGLMMGFRFMENFNNPYLSRSVADLWRRWHISLSTWLRDYLYIPLGGNRHGTFNTYRNLMLTMVLGGAWHGANWTFVLWGAWHGFFLCAERALGLKHIGLLPTLLIIILSMVLFRADNMTQAIAIYSGMLGQNGFSISDHFNWQMTYQATAVLIVGWIFVFWQGYGLDFRKPVEGQLAMRTDGYKRLLPAAGACCVFILALTKLAAASYSPFLYYQF